LIDRISTAARGHSTGIGGSPNASGLPTFRQGVFRRAADLKWGAGGTRPYHPPGSVGMRSTRVPRFLHQACGHTTGIGGSPNAPGLPTFRQGVFRRAADLKWGAGGTRPYHHPDW